MTVVGGFRIVVTAFTTAAVQALLIDQSQTTVVRHLDLPLALTIALVISRPGSAVVTGFVFGIAVDVFQTRLFGLHGLAFALLGPVATVLPLSPLRSRAEIVASLTVAQAVVATGVVAAGGWVSGNGLAPGLFGHLVQVVLWSLAIVLPLTALLGARMGLTTPDPGTVPGSPTSAEWIR